MDAGNQPIANVSIYADAVYGETPVWWSDDRTRRRVHDDDTYAGFRSGTGIALIKAGSRKDWSR